MLDAAATGWALAAAAAFTGCTLCDGGSAWPAGPACAAATAARARWIPCSRTLVVALLMLCMLGDAAVAVAPAALTSAAGGGRRPAQSLGFFPKAILMGLTPLAGEAGCCCCSWWCGCCGCCCGARGTGRWAAAAEPPSLPASWHAPAPSTLLRCRSHSSKLGGSPGGRGGNTEGPALVPEGNGGCRAVIGSAGSKAHAALGSCCDGWDLVVWAV